jgi:small subunit ribosomal protein S6
MWRFSMNIYETVVILNPSLNEDELKSATSKLKDLITGSGGEILKVDVWGKRKLAFEMNKQKFGYYVFLLYRCPSATIKRIEDYAKVFDPVMKYMVIRLGKKQTAALPPEIIGTPVTREEISSLGESVNQA